LADPPATEIFLANPIPPSSPGAPGRIEGPSPRAFHRRLPGYASTPLRRLPSVARDLGLGEVLVKDETERMGLPAFKMLGASWAAYRALSERLGAEPEWSGVEQLARAFDALHPLTLTTATDGNHGRALARFARLAGLDAHILVPAGTADARIEAIRSEGATVEMVDGSYEDAVGRAAHADPRTHLVVSDTSWEGYERIPGWVIEGYDTIFLEIEQQLQDAGMKIPDVVVVPIGVGALGASAAAFADRVWHDGRPALLGVEPVSADCVLVSVARGEITEVPGPHTSIMAGLNCGLPSRLAFPRVRDRFAAFVAIADSRAAAAMVTLAGEGIVGGETGAAALGGLGAALELDAGGVLGLGPAASVLLLVTEGATDPVSYERIVGTSPERVSASASSEG
jgi:diaminopropionate ammonia-lyase